MQSNGHTSMQTPHPLQLSGCTMAMGRSWRFSSLVTLPYVSRMASSGQITPQAPQSIQSNGSMKNAFFGSPLIAVVGQRFSQAVQPVQFSAMIVKGMLLLHLLQDLVRAALLLETVVTQRLLEADPGEEEHQDQHPDDRNVVGLDQDLEELVKAFHGSSVQRRTASVNRDGGRRRTLARGAAFAVRAAGSRGIAQGPN